MPISTESAADIVRLFRTGLGRRPEPAALANFASLLEDGATFYDVAHIIAGSPEFRQLHGDEDICDARYVSFLYHNGLDRTPDPQGEAGLMAAPNRGDGLVIVAGSEEARARTDLYALLYPEGASPQDDMAYKAWLLRYDRLSPTERLAIGRHIDQGMPSRPTFSLMLQVGNHRLDLLEETIASLEAQIYTDWTLIVVYPENLRPGIRTHLREIMRRVPGLVGVEVSSHQGVEGRWRSALAAAVGSFCAFLEPGDQLSRTALYEFAVAIANRPDLVLLYCDEDRLGSDGQRCHPSFKTGWSRDLAYAGDVIGQLAVFSRARIMAVGGIRDEGGSFARYDLLLRVTEGVSAVCIRHLPRLLFHRGRTPGLPLMFPLVRATQQHPEMRDVVLQHFRESHPDLDLKDVYIGGNVWPRIVYPANGTPLVSIIIPTKDKFRLLERCVSSLLTLTGYQNFEVLIADNGSTNPEMLDLLRRMGRDPRLTVLRLATPFNWSTLNNRMARQAKGDMLLFLNDDTEVLEEGWLTEMVSLAQQPSVGVVGARLSYPDGTLQHGGVVLTEHGPKHILRSAAEDNPGYLGQLVLTRDLMAVTGACMLVPRPVFEQIGGFDETFPLTCNDIDFCLRAREAGLRVVWTPHATLMHEDGGTRGRDGTARNLFNACVDVGRLLERWEQIMLDDPFLNANLEATDYTLQLATPPRAPKPWRRRGRGHKASTRTVLS
ncbi:glycosyltransferase [Gluconobacter cerinus]|uniref:glycosyltransferase n=1 Tax=Gluconobacter cerinus TaxID=38307 RepID=UPI001B8D6FC0|nr:glycosyltransferase [Gluconobacter cerinus]MBS1032148.1 glycosyltransferase [Gluconobacter cerinus]